MSSNKQFDVIFDAAAAYRWSQGKTKLKPKGRFVTTLPSLSFAADKVKSLLSSTGADLVMVKSKRADLDLLASWLSSGLSVTIDSQVPIRDVSQSLEKFSRGDVLGRIVVDVINGF